MGSNGDFMVMLLDLMGFNGDFNGDFNGIYI